MSPVQEFFMVVGMLAVTFGVRYSVLSLSGRLRLSDTTKEALKFVPVAVLTALCFPIMFKPEGQWLLSFSNAYLVAGIASILIAAFSRHLLLTIVLGMAVFLLLHFEIFS